MRTPRYSVKQDKLFGPSIIWTVQNSLNNVDAGMCLSQNCLAPLIDLTTGHYNSTGTYSTSLWLAFLASEQQGGGGGSGMRLCSAQQHEYALPHLPEIYQKPPIYGHILDTQRGPHGVRIRGVPLYICIYTIVCGRINGTAWGHIWHIHHVASYPGHVGGRKSGLVSTVPEIFRE